MSIGTMKKDNPLLILLFFLFASFILSFTRIPYSNLFYLLKFVLLLAFVVIYILLKNSKIVLSKESITLFLILSVLSGLAIIVAGATMDTVLNFLLLLGIYLPLIFIVFPNIEQAFMEKVLQIMYITLLVFLVLPSLVLIFFDTSYYEQAGRFRFISYFNNPNELAQFCLVFFLLTFYYLFIKKGKFIKNIANLLLACGSVYIIFLTRSRAALLSAGIFLIIYFFAAVFSIEKKQRNLIALILLSLVLFILFSNYLLDSNANIISYIDSLSSYRLSIWREILDYRNLFPFFAGGFLQSHPQYQVITNAYVELFGNYGLIGLICWCLILVNFSANKNITTKFDKYKTAVICVYIIYYLFESGMQSIVNISSFFFWFIVCTGQVNNK